MRNFFLLFFFILFHFPSESRADEHLLSFIRFLEAGKGITAYDTPHKLFPKVPEKPLTQMSLAEVLKFQKSARKPVSTAMGAYQIIHSTLIDLIKRHNISTSTIFSKNTQDNLARLLIKDCHVSKQKGIRNYANCLASVWAALPLTSGPSAGKSKYQNTAGNKVLTDVPTFLAVLNGKSHFVTDSPTDLKQGWTTLKTGMSRAAAITDQIALNSKKRGLGQSIHTLNFDPYMLD